MKRSLGPLLLVVVSSLCAPASTARAASWSAKNRCGDALKTMQSWARPVYRDKEVDPGDVEAAVRHFNDTNETYRRALNQLAQIPDGELDKSDPELKECVETMAGWESYLTQLRPRIEAAQKGAETLGPFLESTRGKEHAFYTLAAVHYQPDADVLGAIKGSEARQLQAELASLEPGCRDVDGSTMPPARGSSPGGSVRRIGQVEMSSELARKPAAWCYVARHRGELLARAAANRFVFVEGYGNYGLLLPEAVEKTSAEHPDLEAWMVEMMLRPGDFAQARHKAEASFYRDAGLTQPASSDGGVGAQLRALADKVDAAAPEVKFPSGPHDAGFEGRARTALKQLFPDAQARATVMDAPGWTVVKNALGVPLRRYRSGSILYKRPQSKWCMQRTFSYGEEHLGGGRYQGGAAVTLLPATRFLACAP